MYMMLIGQLYKYMVASDSYRVQSDLDMVKSDLHTWLIRAKMFPKIDSYKSGTKMWLKDVKLHVDDVNMSIVPIYGGKWLL